MNPNIEKYKRERRVIELDQTEHVSFADIHLMSFGDALTGRNYGENVNRYKERFGKNE